MSSTWLEKQIPGGDVSCKMCGAPEESLEHFIIECPNYSDTRLEFGMSEADIQDILGFGENIEDVEKLKIYERNMVEKEI